MRVSLTHAGESGCLSVCVTYAGLLDPRWREEKKKQVEEKKTQEEVFAEGMQIGTHLKYLAERRTDIFGTEETMIGRKIGEEEKKKNIPSVQWDGHSGR